MNQLLEALKKAKIVRETPREIPEEVDAMVERAVERVLKDESAIALKKLNLPMWIKPASTAPWVEVTESDNADNSEIPKLEEAYQEGSEEYDPFAGDSADDNIEPLPTFSEDSTGKRYYFGLPPKEESGLTNPEIELDESQVEAIAKLSGAECGCLIGAAGTGKTTVTKYLIQDLLYGEGSTFKPKKTGMQWNIGFVAFTGMAVQVIKENLPEWLHESCKTIHGLLEFMPQESIKIDANGNTKITMPFVPTRDETNQLKEDIIIIDEASMLGLGLWDQLRVACKAGTRIIMIGDLNQLPPIIGEPIFAYALSQWPVAELTHIHRQKGEGANKIIDVAHKILNGKGFSFDTMSTDPSWRVAGGKVSDKADKAHSEIVATVKKLMGVKFADGRAVYDPNRDRIMTAGNGENRETTSCLVQQIPLNEALSLLIRPPTPENPRYIIDAGRVQKIFAEGHRVMATKNEPASTRNRVTNGLTGIIKSIEPNPDYNGDSKKFGPEDKVRQHMKDSFKVAMGEKLDSSLNGTMLESAALDDFDFEQMADDLASRIAGAETDEEIKKADKASHASHIIVIEYATGALRTYWSKAAIEGLNLAYASTVNKCQGSQFPTAIIVCHSAVKQQLSREWLYTAVTRAQGHVIIFYNEYGLRMCLERQKIFGNTIAEKVARYREMLEGIESSMGKIMRKNVVLTVGPNGYDLENPDEDEMED